VGTPFPQITSFAAYVGGSPTNICVGARRLGLQTVLLTALGQDPVGDFIWHFLNQEGVATQFIPRKPGYRTSAVILGIEPPHKFPLVYYREKCADMQLSIDDVLAAPLAQAKVVQFAGTNLYADPCRSATLAAIETARRGGAKIVLDIDFRPDQWHDPRAFGVSIRAILGQVNLVIGTEDEINAAMLTDSAQMHLTHSQISDTKVEGDTTNGIALMLQAGVEAVVEKLGAEGVRLHLPDGTKTDVPGFPVEIYNILGAGDAFGAGFLYGYIKGWDLYKAARLGNACGAIVVTKHGCANFMPTLAEVEAFVQPYGGL
jgi:5-dehydro-2-deoxygluconokinase